MATSLVLTVLGDDKPGFVETLAEAITANGANWLESRMTHLAGKFAGIVHIEAAEEKVDGVLNGLNALSSGDLQILVERSRTEAPAVNFEERVLELVGSDHPGIVHDVTRILAERKVSIEDLNTGTDSASMAGGKVFRATAVIRVPDSVDLDSLRGDLEELANDLMVDISLGVAN
ncbi:glycine cleavage system protein R [Pelagibius sp. Alg239-R121]|uniref:glycine cleavage system protein R n=1 Tax=Pelagibius sp. Alg239-R121 TaxID=2993448 RepID=UPI0024A751FD|nr:ACT domain-containing protein [Pelagibius sp. Alg239-R121]